MSITIFHGQHATYRLLEATDSCLKQELSLILPLTVWEQAAQAARSKKRAAVEEASKLGEF